MNLTNIRLFFVDQVQQVCPCLFLLRNEEKPRKCLELIDSDFMQAEAWRPHYGGQPTLRKGKISALQLECENGFLCKLTLYWQFKGEKTTTKNYSICIEFGTKTARVVLAFYDRCHPPISQHLPWSSSSCCDEEGEKPLQNINYSGISGQSRKNMIIISQSSVQAY